MNLFNIYSSGHLHSRAVCSALARGTKLPVVEPAPLREGGVATYGFLRGLLAPLEAAQSEGRPWVYVDRGYFRATQGSDYSGYFRVTRDAWQRVDRGPAPLTLDWDERWRRLKLEIAPWRRRGEHVLVCPPGETYSQAVGKFAADRWLATTLRTLERSTDREVRVRPKADRDVRPLAADLKNCHALVTFMSNTAAEALLAGVPVFCDPRCAAAPVALTDLERIEEPWLPDLRYEWAVRLAANQWTLDELAAGAANYLFR